MAVDIGSPTWQYDPDANSLLLQFVESCPRSEPDPANWLPGWDYRLSIPLPVAVAKIPHTDPNIPEEESP